MSSNIPGGAQQFILRTAVQNWIARNPGWAARYDLSLWPPYRLNTVEQVAQALVQDPTVIQALRALASPSGQVIEQEVLTLWLPAPEARLLIQSLTQALDIVGDQSRPLWQRADVLVGAGLGLALLLLVIIANS